MRLRKPKLIMLVAMLGALLAAPVVAAESDASRVVEALYDAHQPWNGRSLDLGDRGTLSSYFSEELVGIFMQHARVVDACAEGDMCGIGFDPILGTQDFDDDLKFALKLEETAKGDSKDVVARFRLFNDGGPETRVVYTLVAQGDWWRIAEVRYPALDDATLSAQLREVLEQAR